MKKRISGNKMSSELRKLAYWSYNIWNGSKVLEIFEPENENEREYWLNKFNRNILAFYLSLDDRNKKKLEMYLEREFATYDPNME